VSHDGRWALATKMVRFDADLMRMGRYSTRKDKTWPTPRCAKQDSANRLWAFRRPQALPREQRRYRPNDLADCGGTFNDVESEPAHLFGRQAAKGGHHKDALGRQHQPDFIQGFARFGQLVKIDQEHTRFHPGSTIESWDRPGVNSNDLVALFDELRAQKRALGPFGAEDHYVWRFLFHGRLCNARKGSSSAFKRRVSRAWPCPPNR
jgi:hypothetical protein